MVSPHGFSKVALLTQGSCILLRKSASRWAVSANMRWLIEGVCVSFTSCACWFVHDGREKLLLLDEKISWVDYLPTLLLYLVVALVASTLFLMELVAR